MPKDPAWRFQTVGGVAVAPKTLEPVRPNLGLASRYRKRIDRLIDEMQASLVYWIKARYRANTPEIAQDASPAMELRRTIRKLGRRWQRNFDRAAPELADYFAKAAQDRTDAQLHDILRRGGFSVRFKATATQNDVYQSVIGENVGLIKSIAQQHLTAVEGHVMRAVSRGGDLSELSKTLEESYGVTKRRAAFISKDQTRKAASVMGRVRQQDLGITEAVWVHSRGDRVPRPSHVAMNGKRYNIAKGMWDPAENRYIQPGELIGCTCLSRSIVPGFE